MKKISFIAICTLAVMSMRLTGAPVVTATEMFVTNKVAAVSNYVNTVKAEMEERTPVKRIAMFIIPVNYATNGNFTGFELKASTNNFSHAVGTENTRLQFYAQSEVADTGENGWDKMKMYIGTSHLSSYDVRAYTKLPNTLEWSYDLNSVAVLVDASCLVKHPDGDWLREDNEDLMWCYLRNTSGGVEYEYGTDRTLWRPIAPVRWFSRLPNWAN